MGDTKKRVLVADDDELVRNFLKSLLEGEGYEVILAEDGEQAVVAAKQGPPDLVLLDIYMPRMTGLDALLEMDLDPTATPVIALTGGGQGTGVDPLALASQLGAARTFHKPLPAKELLAAVKELLG